MPCTVFVFRQIIGTKNYVYVWSRGAWMGKGIDIIRMEEFSILESSGKVSNNSREEGI